MEETERVRKLREALTDTAIEVVDNRTSGIVAKGRVKKVGASSAGNPLVELDTGFKVIVHY